MNFILVNGRKPRQQPFCAACCEPIGENYLRVLATGLTYCNCQCYRDGTALSVQPRVRAS
jgi:hypothetical protein